MMSKSTSHVGFGDRLDSVLASRGHLCVGLDPHPYLLEKWNFADNSRDLREFSFRVIDAAVDHVGILKPQVAFFERHGSAGFDVLAQVIERARAAGLLVIADAKRGDIGSTMEAYAVTWLSTGAALEADALTVNPYLGVDSLGQTIDIALSANKGIFLLAATSNPEAAQFQSAAVVDGARTMSLAQHVLTRASALSVERVPQMSVGAVVGATVSFDQLGIESSALASFPVLVPGVGHQGGTVQQVIAQFGHLAERAIISETRSILEAGRGEIAECLKRRTAEVADAFG